MYQFAKRTILSVTALTLTGSSVLLAEEPGGQTIGSGFEKTVKINRLTSVTLFECHKCYVPACLTVQVRNDAEAFFVQPVSTRGGSAGSGFVKKETTRTFCMSQIVEFIGNCAGGNDCELHYRVDLLGEFVAIPDDPNDPNGEQIPAPD